MIRRRALLGALPALAVAAAVGLVPARALAHPNHATLAVAELNPKTGRLEVALKVDPDDLERAIRKATDSKIRPEDPAAEAHVEAYIRERFAVRPPAGKSDRPRRLKWVGMDVKVDEAWLYFEIPIRGIWRLRITNTVFFDLEDGQVNTLNLRDGDTRLTFVTTPDRPVVTVKR